MLGPWLIAGATAALTAATALGYWQGYRAGSEGVQARWNAERVETMAAAAEAGRIVREAERRAADALHQAAVNHAAQIRSRDRAVTNSRRELERLRDALATASSRGNSNPVDTAAATGDDDAAAIARQLLAECAETLVRMGGEAGGLAAQVISLQTYIQTVLEILNATD